MRGLKYCLIIAMGLALASPAPAAGAKQKITPEQAEDALPEAPGDDIFGFTSPTDVGENREFGFAIENSARFGKRDGAYGALGTKFEFSRNLATDAWGAVSFFGDWHRVRNVTGIDNNISRSSFDGVSTELIYRVLNRQEGYPFAASVSFEPRWARIDGVSGQVLNSFTGEVKLFVDAVVVKDRLFWALNLNYAPSAQQILGETSHWAATSSSNISTALSLAVLPDKFYVGLEARYLTAFNRPFLNNKAGEALYLGPNFLYKFSEKVALSAAWTPQIAGKSQALRERTFDLDNYERHQIRVKLAVGF